MAKNNNQKNIVLYNSIPQNIILYKDEFIVFVGGGVIFLIFLILKLKKKQKLLEKKEHELNLSEQQRYEELKKKQKFLEKKEHELIQKTFNPKGINFTNLSEQQCYEDLIRFGFSSNDIFFNLYVPIDNNSKEFSQIDLAVLTRVGLIVFEVKSYNGVIKGCIDEQIWTASYGSGYKQQNYTFQNPIIQNSKHVFWLSKFLKNKIKFFNVVVFYSDCELRYTKYISNTRSVINSYDLKHCLDKILFNNKTISYDKQKIVDLLTIASQNGNNDLIKRQHVKNVENIKNNNHSDDNDIVIQNDDDIPDDLKNIF